MGNVSQMAWLTIIYLLTQAYEVLADYCGDNIFCHSPYKCCIIKKGCCYDSMLHNSKHFRLQIWNMWYFWFLIIFMMMSCFGGCGYYRRRRLAMLARSSSPPPMRATTVVSQSQRRPRVRSFEPSGTHLHFYAYNGPGVNPLEPVSNLPPAYAEVVSQPGLYPINKVELPPYPGTDKPEDSHFVFSPDGTALLPHRETSLPPPYSEHQCDTTQPSVPQSAVPSHLSQSGDLSQCLSSQGGVVPPALPAGSMPENTTTSSSTTTNHSH